MVAPKPDERVAIIVPTSNIETWVSYLGCEIADETNRN